MSINFDVNYDHMNNYNIFEEEFNTFNDKSLESRIFFIDNEKYFGILQNNIKSKM